MSSDAPVTFLTQDAYDRLAHELEQLSTTGREEIAKRIAVRPRRGRPQGERRLPRRQGRAGQAGGAHPHPPAPAQERHVSEAPESNGVVEPGTVVTAIVAGGEEVFLLGNREIAVGSELDVYSEASPLGAAILGRKEGEKTSYTAPNGREITVEIVKVETYNGQ